MQFYLDNWTLMLGVVCLVSAIGYMASPRFVDWVLTHDRRGRMWAALLGPKRAAVAMRSIFSVILIVLGLVFIILWLNPN